MNIGVVGGTKCSKKTYQEAQRLGELVAQEGWVLVCGGGSGVMEAACRGAKQKGGLTAGILPSIDGREANNYLDFKMPTGLGYARNFLLIRSADIVVAFKGKYGTLSEIAFAFGENKKVIGFKTWAVKGIIKAKSILEIIKLIKRYTKKS